MFKLLFKYTRESDFIEVMTGTRDEIYDWIDKHKGYDSKIVRVK